MMASTKSCRFLRLGRIKGQRRRAGEKSRPFPSRRGKDAAPNGLSRADRLFSESPANAEPARVKYFRSCFRFRKHVICVTDFFPTPVYGFSADKHDCNNLGYRLLLRHRVEAREKAEAHTSSAGR